MTYGLPREFWYCRLTSLSLEDKFSSFQYPHYTTEFLYSSLCRRIDAIDRLS